MTAEAVAALTILVGAVVALVLGRWSPDLIGFGVVLVLTLTGLVSVDLAFAGFGSPAVIAVAMIFVISAGLDRTGVALLVSRPLRRMAGRSHRRLLVILMAATGLLSGVMNNLAALGVLLPVSMAIAARRRISPTQLLLPLANAARFGGALTLVASPSTVVIADILSRRGLARLGLFDFLPVGLPMLAIGIAWMATVGRRFLPERQPEELLRVTRRRGRLVKLYRLSERVFEAGIPAGSPLRGKSIEESEFGRTYGITVVSVLRDGQYVLAPPKDLRLREGDRLVIEGRLDELLQAEAFERMGIEVARADAVPFDSSEVGIVEAIVHPRSGVVGRTLRDLDFRDRYGVTVLALWREGRPIRTRIGEVPLQVGDGLLLQGPRKALRGVGAERDFIVMEEEMAQAARQDRQAYALVAVAGMIVFILAGVPVAVATAVAAGVIVVSGGLTAEESYRAIDWRSIVVIGAMAALGVALESTGAAAGVARALVELLGSHPLPALIAVFLTAMLLGQFIPSVAMTLILVPVALDIASRLGTSPLPFAMAIIAASGLTILPFSNPVMLLVMAPGGYKQRDYVRSGLPLLLILLVVMAAVIPLAFPFHP